MKRIMIAGIAAGGLLLCGAVSAAEKPGQWYVTPMVSGIWVDDNRQTDDDIGLALAIGRAVSENVNVEFHAFAFQLEGINEMDYWGYGADVVRTFYRDSRITPYILGGAGFNKHNRLFGSDGNDLYLNAAAGFLTDLTQNSSIALRTELRYRLDWEKPQSSKDYLVNVGLQIPFGRAYAQPEPPAPPPPPPPAPRAQPAPPPPPPPPPPAPVPGQIITLDGVQFAFDSSEITADERGTLREAVATLQRYPEVKVVVAGHTDSVGTVAYNMRLSERRAAAVVDYLANAGIARNRLAARGFGPHEPVADNATDAGRAQNRRVELRVVD